MKSKSKGTRLERELIHMFYDTKLFMAFRAAGSGSIPLPCPDLIAGGKGRVLAIECKAIKKNRRYLDKKQLEDLDAFGGLFGAETWVGVRFNNEEWYFLKTNHLGRSKNNIPFISLELAKNKGLQFRELIGEFKQNKLT